MQIRRYRALEKRLGCRFRDQSLLEMALTHPSYRFESEGVACDNQRLEFLGDAVLDVLLAQYLYEIFPSKDEGFLTAARSRLASGRALAKHAARAGIGDFLRMGNGEEASGGRTRESNLADALEALIGAAYLDRGHKGARAIFDSVISPDREELVRGHRVANPKGRLQEYAQAKWKTGPSYRTITEDGPAHARVFTVVVKLPDGEEARGRARSKQQAEARAAETILSRLLPESGPDTT